MKIYNAFGIKPTNTYVSAGSDYYIPNIDDFDFSKSQLALKAFEKSYNVSEDDINIIRAQFEILEDTNETNQITNMTHLFLALGNKKLDELKKYSLVDAVDYFYDKYLICDKSGIVGLRLQLNDTLFINSGIKVALDTVLSDQKGVNPQVNTLRNLGIGVSGLYVNKSGKGNAGFDIRACLVDEDYAGYVHLSMAYTKDVFEDGKNIIFVGDKLVQMMLLPVFHTQYEEVTENEYKDIMSNSNRGDSGFGSSDIKH